MTRLPTRRGLVVAGAGGLLVLAGITAQAGWLFVLAAGALGLVAGSLVVRHRLAAVEVSRTAPRQIRVGDTVRAGLALRNRSTASVPMLVVKDDFTAFDPVTVASERIPAGATAHVELVRTARRRGVFTGGSVTLTSGAPFGLARSRRRDLVATEVTVVPRWVELRSFPFLDPSSAATDNPEEKPVAGLGQDYMGIREYRSGDPLRSVHWRSTARASKLIVREYEREMSSRIAIVLAGADHGEGPESSFETLVSATASVGIHALTAGHSLYLARPAREGIERLAEPSTPELLTWLAAAQPLDASTDEVVADVQDALGDKATVILIVDGAGATGASIANALRAIRQRGGRAVVVVADSASWNASQEPAFSPSDGRSAEALRMLRADRELETCLAG